MGDFAIRSENALARTPTRPEIGKRMARLCRPKSFQLPLLNTERLQMCPPEFSCWPLFIWGQVICIYAVAYRHLWRKSTVNLPDISVKWTWPHFKATLSETNVYSLHNSFCWAIRTAMRTNRKIGFLKHSVQTRKAKRSSRATSAPSTSCFSISWQGKTITHLSVHLSEWIEEAENVALSSLLCRYWPQLSTRKVPWGSSSEGVFFFFLFSFFF